MADKNQTIQLLKDQIKGGIKTEIKPKHLLLLKIDLPDIDNQKSIVNYYLKDRLGNIRVTLDEDGKVVTTDDYALGIPLGLSFWLANAGQIF